MNRSSRKAHAVNAHWIAELGAAAAACLRRRWQPSATGLQLFMGPNGAWYGQRRLRLIVQSRTQAMFSLIPEKSAAPVDRRSPVTVPPRGAREDPRIRSPLEAPVSN